MKATTHTPKQALNQAYRKEKVGRTEINKLKEALKLLLDRIANPNESEENHKGHFQDFLKEVWYKEVDCLVAPKGRIDLVVHDGPKAKDPVGVMIEAKRKVNKSEMFSASKPNVKSLHELVLYFLRERNEGNTAIKTLMITDGDETYLFADREFERLFWEKKTFLKKVLAADADGGKTNNTVYEIIKNHIDTLDETLHGTTFTISQFRKWADDGDPETDDHLIPLYKILSPPHLLRRPFANDSNKLDKGFYRELLHIIGLEEVGVDSKGKEKKNGGKKIIRRATGANRHPASLLENTLQIAGRDNRLDKAPDFRAYGTDTEERRFAVAVELCTTWVNRVLFLKLLESQLLAYHGTLSPNPSPRERGENYRFLTKELVQDYDALNTLFIDVLNTQPHEREGHVEAFAHVPYLNSSLFEISPLEASTLQISFLKDMVDLPLAPQSILRTRDRARSLSPSPSPGERGAMKPLEYLFAFLDAYDFSSEGKARIQEDNKRLINASVLGLIFEKINGYRDGSFYTPGFITEYMCRETIRRAVVQKFRDDSGHFAAFDSDSFDDLANYLGNKYKAEERLAANQLVNGLTVCDPAVGSGHFLVSALNELIATKSALGILGADAGAKNVDIKAVVENDELIVTDRHDEPYEYHVRTDANGQIRADDLTQTIQETIFHEKRTLIENCLFGVDLNPNSVKICRLRLWIELLKHAYYRRPDERSEQSRAVAKSNIANQISHIAYRAPLETLPNIDINIKQGNSLISRFALDDDLSGALADSGLTLADYRQAVLDYHRATGKDAKDKLLGLIEDVKGNFRTHISRNDKTLKKLAAARGKLTKLQGLLEMGDLFGSVDEKAVRKEMAPLEKQVAKLDAEVESVRSNAIYDGAFEWRFEFPAVLDEAGRFVGFDVVVGNPPYIRIQELRSNHSEAVDYYNEKYITAGSGNYDLYAVFYEKAVDILSKNGFASFITPHKFTNATSGKGLRKLLGVKSFLSKIIHFGHFQIFDDATTYTGLFFFDKEDKEYSLYAEHDSPDLSTLNFSNLPQSFLEVEQWQFVSGKEAEILQRINHFPSLIDSVKDIFQGIKTSADATYILTLIEETKEHFKVFSKETQQEYILGKEYIHKLIKGGNSAAFSISYENLLLIFPYKSGKLEEFDTIHKNNPELYQYLLEVEDSLRSRENGKMDKPTWYGYVYPKALTTIVAKKLFTPDIAPSSRVSFDENAEFTFTGGTAGGFGIIPKKDDQFTYFLGLLNSRLFNWFIERTSTQMRGGWYSFESKYISKFPVCTESNTRISNLATQILTAKQTDPTFDTSVLEGEIDVLVYRLYELTFEEVLVVDAAFGLSEDEYQAVQA